MKKQGLIIDIKKMKTILEDIEETDKKMCKELGINYIPSKKFLIPIINKQGLSDTWEIQ